MAEVSKPVVGSVGTSSSLASRHTETYTTQHLYQSSKTSKNMNPTPPPSWTTPHSSTILIEMKETEQDIILLFVIIGGFFLSWQQLCIKNCSLFAVPIMVSFMFVACFTLLILLIFRKHRKGIDNGSCNSHSGKMGMGSCCTMGIQEISFFSCTVECPENKENIELDSNPVYELTKPIKLQQNELYTYTAPEKL